MTDNAAREAETQRQIAFLHEPVGRAGSGRLRYGAAMYLFNKGLISAQMLEVYRMCCKFDDEDPITIAEYEGMSVPDIARADTARG